MSKFCAIWRRRTMAANLSNIYLDSNSGIHILLARASSDTCRCSEQIWAIVKFEGKIYIHFLQGVEPGDAVVIAYKVSIDREIQRTLRTTCGKREPPWITVSRESHNEKMNQEKIYSQVHGQVYWLKGSILNWFGRSLDWFTRSTELTSPNVYLLYSMLHAVLHVCELTC